MAPRRRTTIIEPMEEDPIAQVMLTDQEAIADELSEALGTLDQVDQAKVKGTLYLVERGTNKYQWIKDVYPPFDLSNIMNELKDETGGGDFQLRITATGRRGVIKNINFSIMKDRHPMVTSAPKEDNSRDMFMMMMNMQMEAGREARAAAERQMNLMMEANRQTTSVLVAAMQGGTKATDLIPLIAAMKTDPPKANGMGEMLEVMKSAKSLFGEGGGPAFDADDLVGSAVKLGGPILQAIGRAAGERRQAPAANPADYQAPTGPLMLENPAPRSAVALPMGNPTGTGARMPSRFPVLDLIRDDLMFMFERGHEADRAAEVVYDVIERNNVGDEQINDLVGAFIAAGPAWLDELAGEGVDLRRDPAWADEFLSQLAAIHGDAERGPDDTARPRGNGLDAEAHGQPGAGGLALHAGPQPGRGPGDQPA